MKLYELIKLKRKEKNLTQQELADLLFISSKTISKWETGRGLPEITMLNQISNILEIEPNEMMVSIKNTSEKNDFKIDLISKNSMYISLVVLILGSVLFISGSEMYNIYDQWFILLIVIGGFLAVLAIFLYFILMNQQQLKYGISKSTNNIYTRRFLSISYFIIIVSISSEFTTNIMDSLMMSEITIIVLIQAIIVTFCFLVLARILFSKKNRR